MATYILLMVLTPAGQMRAFEDSEYLLHAEKSIEIAGVQTLGVYAVLGPYDFVTMVEADSNEAVARFSLELGVKAGVHVTTLPVVPAARLKVGWEEEEARLVTEVALDAPEGSPRSRPSDGSEGVSGPSTR